MVLQFVAFTWNAIDDSACHGARDLCDAFKLSRPTWVSALSARGIKVFSNSADGIPLAGGGVVLGSLFSRRGTRVEDVRGSALVEEFWGNYVAFFLKPSAARISVLRGPASALPCFHVSIGNVHAYFSHVEPLANLIRAGVTFDWQHVARLIVGPSLSIRTGFKEIREVRGGTCEIHEHGRCTSVDYWRPFERLDRAVPADFASSARELRESISSTVSTYASRFRKIGVALSGGLDSSIVLASLRYAPSRPEVVCLTQFSNDAGSDEREFAAHSAARANAELTFVERESQIDLRRMFTRVRFESNPGFHTPDTGRPEADTARRLHVDAVFKGHGGDELFCRHHSHLYLIDLLEQQGPGRQFFSAALHSSVMEGQTVWRTVSDAVARWLKNYRPNLADIHWRDNKQDSLIDPDLMQSLIEREEPIPPASPGRAWQMSLALARRPYYTPFMRDDDPETVSPLLSQPVIETCMRIPTWLQMNGKRDRAVARAAFVSDLAPEVHARTSKGGAATFVRRIVRANMSFIREMLMEGELVRQHIVHRPTLDATLADEPSRGGCPPAALLELLSVEAWVKAWRDGGS